jgi:hypothetical protein
VRGNVARVSPRTEWVTVRWPNRRSRRAASGRARRPTQDIGVSMSGQSAPRTAKAAVAGVEPEAQPGPGEDHEHQAERRVGRRLHRLSLHREAHGLAERQGGEVGVLLGPEEVEPRTGGSS